jgi:hypothetical protein
MKRLADGIWVEDDLLTRAEAESVIEQAEATGFAVARLADCGRRNSEVFLRREETRSELAARLHCILSASSVELAEVFECYRYSSGAAVAAHADSPTRIGKELSVMTLVVYLNENFEGGQTIFPEIGLEVQPRNGSGLVFNHGLIHAGSEVRRGTKYILRTAVSFKRERT